MSFWCFLILHLFTADSPCHPRSMVCSSMGSLAEKRSHFLKKCLHHLRWFAVAGCLMMRPQLMNKEPWNHLFLRQRYKGLCVFIMCVLFSGGTPQRGLQYKEGLLLCSALLFD